MIFGEGTIRIYPDCLCIIVGNNLAQYWNYSSLFPIKFFCLFRFDRLKNKESFWVDRFSNIHKDVWARKSKNQVLSKEDICNYENANTWLFLSTLARISSYLYLWCRNTNRYKYPLPTCKLSGIKLRASWYFYCHK